MKKIYKCVGCGGIGGWFAAHISRLLDNKQIKDSEFTFYDFDIVERKNILYQNFDISDIGSSKTDALMFKYPVINFVNKKIEPEELMKPYDLLIICADNNVIRKQVYAESKRSGRPFIDSRSNGKVCGIFSSETEDYLSTISDSDESSSCQHPYQIKKEEIELGNVIIASILAQYVLDYSRTGMLPPDFIQSF